LESFEDKENYPEQMMDNCTLRNINRNQMEGMGYLGYQRIKNWAWYFIENEKRHQKIERRM
jgi:hypothetical protein